MSQVALSFSLDRAQSTRSYISKELRATKGKERENLEFCLDQISESVHQLSGSIGEVRVLVSPRTPSADVRRHISNVQSWVSAAMVYVTDCTEGGSPGEKPIKFKGTIMVKLLNVEESICIVLDLFDQYAERYYKP
ncbi:hypothetical protein Tsubulata_019042 [Turnera subulata]|uniref:Pectinesterase inhibitor domain-containing protein n=1 Tax=Turnera subulata TaxID=218843 RepID=A0A9Q0G817_9ROSI|nr:hypothetical protein Tsubulata_019042 [Turnera subulata]